MTASEMAYAALRFGSGVRKVRLIRHARLPLTFANVPRIRDRAEEPATPPPDTPRRLGMIIAGGGTGGHLFPGIAIAEEFLRRDPGNRILFIGTERGLEKTDPGHSGFPAPDHPGGRDQGAGAGCGPLGRSRRSPRAFSPPSGSSARFRPGNRRRRGRVRLGTGGPRRPRHGNRRRPSPSRTPFRA